MYTRYILRDMISWRARMVDDIRSVVDHIMRMLDHGISRRVVCYLLMSVHYQLDQLLADVSRLGLRVVTYVGTRAASRCKQIDVSRYTVYTLYRVNYVSWETYSRATHVLNHEEYAVYTRWREFLDDLADSFHDLRARIEDVLSYVESKMDEVCR